MVNVLFGYFAGHFQTCALLASSQFSLFTSFHFPPHQYQEGQHLLGISAGADGDSTFPGVITTLGTSVHLPPGEGAVEVVEMTVSVL